MTADEFIPIFINITTDVFSIAEGAEIFEGITLLEIMVGFFAVGIVFSFIKYYINRNKGGDI